MTDSGPPVAGLIQLFQAIQLCLERKLKLPALMLLFSAIDIAAWLTEGNLAAGVKARFTRWISTYLLPNLPAETDCTALDLYGARCGLIHSYIPDSDLSAKGHARLVMYAWGDSDYRTLKSMIDLAQMQDRVALQVEHLVDAFYQGLERMGEDIETDPVLNSRADKRAEKLFTTLSEPEAQRLLRWGQEQREQSPTTPP